MPYWILLLPWRKRQRRNARRISLHGEAWWPRWVGSSNGINERRRFPWLNIRQTASYSIDSDCPIWSYEWVRTMLTVLKIFSLTIYYPVSRWTRHASKWEGLSDWKKFWLLLIWLLLPSTGHYVCMADWLRIKTNLQTNPISLVLSRRITHTRMSKSVSNGINRCQLEWLRKI